MSTEDARIALLRDVLEQSGRKTATIDIGDDAAVLPWAEDNLVVSVDAQVEGTHFRTDWCTFEDIGYRSFMAAASDLAAMGARIVSATSALTLPTNFSDEALRGLAKGQRLAADELGCAVVGGNLARGSELSVTTTVFGHAKRPLVRSGARDGDEIYVAGVLGLARAGLLSFERAIDVPLAREAFRRPVARLSAGLAAAAQGCSSCMDLSDGLAEDAVRLAAASNVSLWFEGESLVSIGGQLLNDAAAALSESPLALAVVGGEDYALLATGRTLPEGFVQVGRVGASASDEGLVFVDGAPLTLRGFSHFEG